MRNPIKEAPALVNIERNPLWLLVLLGITAAVSYYAWTLLADFNPLGFIISIPAGILLFQLIWLLLNPFAEVFKDRFDIRQSFIHRSTHYFTDIKKINAKDGSFLFITFFDDDIEKVSLRGIKPAHVALLEAEIRKQIKDKP